MGTDKPRRCGRLRGGPPAFSGVDRVRQRRPHALTHEQRETNGRPARIRTNAARSGSSEWRRLAVSRAPYTAVGCLRLIHSHGRAKAPTRSQVAADGCGDLMRRTRQSPPLCYAMSDSAQTGLDCHPRLSRPAI